ncbi:hypothetical protein [Allobaculum sp. Allo2]|uniref:hypothetical protein n=1 Tax=Allobaculum sp. Allo2 TaxID=2853432 RepID=UPI001F6048EA|nr:hypothetical protein [Allobaculum sp. Allo2]UNT94345.1 hypothetical protein KWG61_07085 [Allobaculum sp. Allo2]
MMKLFIRTFLAKKNKTEPQALMARLIVKTYDVTNPKYILPILDALKKTRMLKKNKPASLFDGSILNLLFLPKAVRKRLQIEFKSHSETDSRTVLRGSVLCVPSRRTGKMIQAVIKARLRGIKATSYCPVPDFNLQFIQACDPFSKGMRVR